LNPKRFELIDEDYQMIVRDTEHHLNFMFLASGGMGHTTQSVKLAKKVVDFLNSLDEKETLLYPFDR